MHESHKHTVERKEPSIGIRTKTVQKKERFMVLQVRTVVPLGGVVLIGRRPDESSWGVGSDILLDLHA